VTVSGVNVGLSAELCCLCGHGEKSSSHITVCASCGLGKHWSISPAVITSIYHTQLIIWSCILLTHSLNGGVA